MLVTIVEPFAIIVANSAAMSILVHVQVFLQEFLGHKDGHFNYNSYCQMVHQYT